MGNNLPAPAYAQPARVMPTTAYAPVPNSMPATAYVPVAPRAAMAPTAYVANGMPATTYAPATAYAPAPAPAYAPATAYAPVVNRVPMASPSQGAMAQPMAAYAQAPRPMCNQMLANGCYLAMRKFSTPAGSELRCAMVCD
jgi:hypothetical protein